MRVGHETTYAPPQRSQIFYFQSQFSVSKISGIFLIFFSLKNIGLGVLLLLKCFGILTLFSTNSSLGAPCAANLWIRPLFAMDLITRSIAEFAMDVYGKVLNSY